MNAAATASLIPRRALLWLSAALLFLAPTFIGSVVLWAPLLLLCALLAKFWMHRSDRRLRSLALKIALAITAFGAVFLTYGSPTGIEPGVTILIVLGALKLFESHTARDFHVLIMVGWVLCLCAFMLSQDFAIALCVFAAFVLLVAALVQFHRGALTGSAVWPPLTTTLRLLAQALPIVALLFFFFPRGPVAMRFQLAGAAGNSVGFSGQLSPGSVAALATSDEPAFRVEFPDGNMPARQDLYWRGAVLWQGDGLNWNAGAGVGRARASERQTTAQIRQRITIEPHIGRWLFALDRPVDAPAGATLAPGRYLNSIRAVSSIRRYDVLSAADAGEDDLHPRERAAALRPPSTVSPAMRELVNSWTTSNREPRDVINAALSYFRTQGFVYSLSPGQYGGAGALDELLFRRKSGFCEHYAGAFATLMRVAGIPSRVVVGYLGGQFNQYGNYLLVRQSDAHAWCEVWLPDIGWTRVDPTSVIAPERLSLGSLRQMQTTSIRNQPNAGNNTATRGLPERGILGNLRLAWDTVSYTWDSRVLSFDVEGQRDFLASFGMGAIAPLWQLLWVLGAAALLLGIYLLATLSKARPQRDPVRVLYEAFCRAAARLGAARSATEGPADFARRAAALLPTHRANIEQITSAYIALRYSPDASAFGLQSFRAEVRAFVSRARAR